MAERLFVDVSTQGTLLAPTAQARAALARRAGRWVLMPSSTQLLLLSRWEGPETAGTDSHERAMLMGEVGGVGLLDLLSLFNQTRRSARIVVSRGKVERAILLREGDIASVASSDPRDRLGEFLVRIGKLGPAQLQAVVEGAQQAGRKLGQHLVASGALSNHELWNAIQQQLLEIICDVVTWQDGSYAVFSLPEGFQFPSTPPLPTQMLVLEAVRRADEMGLYRAKIPTFDTRLVATGTMPAEVSPLDLQALQFLASPRSVRDLANHLQRAEFDATRVAYGLLQQRAVRTDASGAPADFGAMAPAAPAPVPHAVPLAVPHPAAPVVAAPPTLPEVIGAFAEALRDVDREVAAAGAADGYRHGIVAFLAEPASAYAGVYAGVTLRADGQLDLGRLAANALPAGPEAARVAYDALNELAFFALFQASELLPRDKDEALALRVRQILSQLHR